MQAFQAFHILILISLTTSIEAQEYSKPRCKDHCGSVDIPYPFGIGRNCSFNDWYNVDCKSPMEWYNSEKPYLLELNNAEVMRIRSSEYMAGIRSNTITVKISGINANCSSPVYTSNLVQTTNPSKNPYAISGSSNVLVFKGCGHAAIMEHNGNIISGCSSTCHNDTVVDLNNCYGVGCCQTTIPHDLFSFTLKLTHDDRDVTCGSAFLVLYMGY